MSQLSMYKYKVIIRVEYHIAKQDMEFLIWKNETYLVNNRLNVLIEK